MTTRNGTPGNDTLIGTSDDDSLYGFAGADRLFGDGGNDLLVGGTGNDLIDGGNGSDTASYADASAGISVNLSLTGPQATGDTGTDTLISIENIIGSAFADRLAGDGGDNILDGGAGLDTVSYAGATAGITIDLARSGVQATGGAGNDTLLNFENVTGSAFNDWFSGTSGNNVFAAGLGIDTLSYANANAGVTVNLTSTFQQDTFGAGRDTLFGIENLVGSAFADALSGSDGDNSLDGGAGVDRVSYGNAIAAVTVSLALQGQAQDTGGSGSDTLRNFENLTGSGFDDLLAGDAGKNVISGGLGNDTISYAAAAGAVNVGLGVTSVQDTWAGGNDTLLGFENLTGSDFGDLLRDDGGDNVIRGGGGNDAIGSSGGRDTVFGGTGIDLWVGDYTQASEGLTARYDGTLEDLWTLSNGTIVREAEGAFLELGSGNDTIDLLAGAVFLFGASIDGGAGSDKITIDLSARDEAMTFSAYAYFDSFTGAPVSQGTFTGQIDIDFRFFENTTLAFGTGDDEVFINFGPLAAGGIFSADGGEGNDHLEFYLSGTSDNFTVGADGSVAIGDIALRNFETFTIGLVGVANVAVTGNGDDIFNLISGSNRVDGRGGADEVRASGQRADFTLRADGSGGALLVDANPGDGNLGNVVFRGIETLRFIDAAVTSFAATGTAFADTLAGTSLMDMLTGLGGDDAVNGYDGSDTAVFTGNRADYVIAGNGANGITVRDLVAGRDGTDTVVNVELLRFADVIVAARALTFTSSASFSVAENARAVGTVVASDPAWPGAAVSYAIIGGLDAARFTIDAATGALAFLTAPNFELPGDSGGDNVYEIIVAATDGTATSQSLQVRVTDIAEVPTQTYTGTSAANVFAVTGPDGWTISGLGGIDRLTGGGNADVLIGGKGNDVLAGGDGDDIFKFAAGDGIDAIDGGAGFDRFLATSANAVIGLSSLAGIEAIDAGGFAGVRLVGTTAANIIDLSATVLTGIGSISGLGGNDTIIGSAGDDRIIGGAGADTLTGGAGNDVFAYTIAADSLVGTARADRIVDFTSGADIIDLGGIDADATLAGNQAFAFTGVGQLRVGTDSAGNVALFGNISGSIAADFQISLYGAPAIGVADLLL